MEEGVHLPGEGVLARVLGDPRRPDGDRPGPEERVEPVEEKRPVPGSEPRPEEGARDPPGGGLGGGLVPRIEAGERALDLGAGARHDFLEDAGRQGDPGGHGEPGPGEQGEVRSLAPEECPVGRHLGAGHDPLPGGSPRSSREGLRPSDSPLVHGNTMAEACPGGPRGLWSGP